MVQVKHKGTLNEQIVKLHLLEQGLDVFENISPHGEIDLISYNPQTGEVILYDVTTVLIYVKRDKSISYTVPKRNVSEIQAKGIKLVGVLPDKTIMFF